MKADGTTVAVEGLEFVAFVDIEEKDGYKKNVIKGLAITPKASEDLPF